LIRREWTLIYQQLAGIYIRDTGGGNFNPLAPVLLPSLLDMGLPFINGQPKRRDQVIAIDIGGCTTKAIHVQRKGEQMSLVNYAVMNTPQEKTLSRQAITDTLKKVTSSIGSGRSRRVTLALGVNECIFRQVEVPLMPLDDMRLMLKFHSKNYLQQDLPDHVFDCYYTVSKNLKPTEAPQPAKGGNQIKQKIMVGGATQKLIDEMQQAVRDAGLIPDQIVPGVIGPANAFETAEPEAFGKEAVALVDLGYKNTTITILDCGEIKLNRVVALGGERITTGLAEALGISPVEAEGIKIGMPHEVQQNLETVLNPLSRELRASIDFFEHQADKTIGQIFVSGGSARSDFLLQCLQNQLMVPCKSWNPARSLHMDLSPDKMGEIEQIAPQLTVAIGVAATAF
jgi:type IV pilus assembly protein PilM